MPAYDDPDYFEQLYARDPDPWRFATSDYEREKYAATVAAIPDRRYARAFEIGCSIGVLTAQLLPRCDHLLGVDIAAAPLEEARRRCPGAEFRIMDLRTDWPDGPFDLILFSEVLYYLGLDGIDRVARLSAECLAPGGVVALVNWRGPTDGACTGEEAADRFIAGTAARLSPVSQERAERYRLDVLADRSTARPTL